MYRGKIVRSANRIEFQVFSPDGDPLSLYLDVCHLSETGFSWGIDNSGSAQLALALLADVTGDEDLAVRLHEEFKRDFVLNWSEHGDWLLNEMEIAAWARAREVNL